MQYIIPTHIQWEAANYSVHLYDNWTVGFMLDGDELTVPGLIGQNPPKGRFTNFYHEDAVSPYCPPVISNGEVVRFYMLGKSVVYSKYSSAPPTELYINDGSILYQVPLIGRNNSNTIHIRSKGILSVSKRTYTLKEYRTNPTYFGIPAYRELWNHLQDSGKALYKTWDRGKRCFDSLKMSALLQEADEFARVTMALVKPGETTRYTVIRTASDYAKPFKFSSMDTYFNKPAIISGIGPNNYTGLWLCQHAFLQACEEFPSLSDNSIQNAMGIIELISNLKKGKLKVPEKLRDMWLAYRYSYTTTVMDLKEALHYFVIKATRDMSKEIITVYGTAYMDGIQCRCQVRASHHESPTKFEALVRQAYETGLWPDWYILWDTIPFSFIIDWFVPIGDVLHAYDSGNQFTGDLYKFHSICYSFSYSADMNDRRPPQHMYVRWYASGPPKLDGMYWYSTEDETSSKTIIMRMLDALSLFVGRK